MIVLWGRRKGFKSWFVEPYKQIRLGIIMIILNLTFSFLILGIFGYYVIDMFNTISQYFILAGDAQYITWTKMRTPIIIGLGLIIIFIILTILIAVKYTYQIYGPLVSIHRFLDKILNNEIPEKLVLRQTDQLQELAQKLNQISEMLNFDKRTSQFVAIYKFLDDLIEDRYPNPLKLRSSDTLHVLVEKINLLATKFQQIKSTQISNEKTDTQNKNT